MDDAEKERMYKAAIADMAVRKAEWLLNNPNAEILVSFPRCEKGFNIIGTLTDGIERGVVRCNPAGRELLESMAGDLNPTIVMAKIAFEV